ncbi:MAG: hypothetical protein MJH10_18410, partial [Epibacterium sp.]|nr:hypothetical protein [Epibacterium sp.]
KAHLRKRGARAFTDLFAAIGDICDMLTKDECWSFLKNAGYASTWNGTALEQDQNGFWPPHCAPFEALGIKLVRDTQCLWKVLPKNSDGSPRFY